MYFFCYFYFAVLSLMVASWMREIPHWCGLPVQKSSASLTKPSCNGTTTYNIAPCKSFS
ncbi:Uncharacterized protein BM_BM1297 [Brugia malayi]|uniref:Bm1297 n=1 Tax=Brugia malayi TaxID=6279 RepID=A0A4E9FBQ4_BRUMA|nr:Uncharacterized protein BM_BM1297 [Brugia malayi]VIO93564.1 Uncharacterized protein BM_BM1297 [Brugia malayi]